MEFALTGEDGLLEFLGLFDNPCGVFLVHACENLVEFLGVAFGDGSHGALIARGGIFDEVEFPFAAFLVEGVAGADVLEFDGGADITGLEGVDGGLDLAADTVDLGEAFL